MRNPFLYRVFAVLMMLCLLCISALADYTESEMAEEEYLAYTEWFNSIFQYKYGDFYYNYNEDGTIRITFYDGRQGDVTIPAEIAGQPVTVIGSAAFSQTYRLETITLPESVTLIEERAFEYSNLSQIYFSQTPIIIRDYAFLDCNSLTDFVIPDTVSIQGANPFAWIDSDAFHLSVSSSHPSLAMIDGVLFDQETNTLICYPRNLENTDYTIPDGTAAIAGSAFECNEFLQTITLCSGLTSIGSSAFRQCISLEEISCTDDILSIGEHAFEECMNLKHFDFPIGLHTIPAYCFNACDSFVAIQIPAHVTSIGEGAFEAWNLKKIYVPQSVESIGAYNFSLNYYDFDQSSDQVTLIVEENSYAQQYAEENNINYEFGSAPSGDFLLEVIPETLYSYG